MSHHENIHPDDVDDNRVIKKSYIFSKNKLLPTVIKTDAGTQLKPI